MPKFLSLPHMTRGPMHGGPVRSETTTAKFVPSRCRSTRHALGHPGTDNMCLGRSFPPRETSASRLSQHTLHATLSKSAQPPSLVSKPSLTRAREIYGEVDEQEQIARTAKVKFESARRSNGQAHRDGMQQADLSRKKRVVIGGRTFSHLDEIYQYFGAILARTPLGARVMPSECNIILDLLKMGHKAVEVKLGVGVEYIYADLHPQYNQKCFMIHRKDGSTIDFSYRKCIHNLVFNQWENSPPKIILLRNEARNVRCIHSRGLKSQAMLQDAAARLEAVFQGILNVVESQKQICHSTALIATNGLSLCVQSDWSLQARVTEHSCYENLMEVVGKATKNLPPFLMVSQLSALTALSPSNSTGEAVYNKLAKRIFRTVEGLDAFDFVLLLQTFSKRGYPSSVDLDVVLSAFRRKVSISKSRFSLHQVSFLVRALDELNVFPPKILKNIEISTTFEGHDGVHAAQILDRLATMEVYPGERFFNSLVSCVVHVKDVDYMYLTFVWMAVVRLRHKLPSNLQKELFNLADSRFDAMPADDLACWIWGFGNQAIEPAIYDKFLSKVVLGAVNGELSMRKTSLCLWSMAVLKKYEMPEFKSLWSTINQVNAEMWDTGTRSTIFQVSMAAELECPSLRLKLSGAQYSACSEAWLGLVNDVTISPLHQSVYKVLRNIGFKVVCEYVAGRNLFSVDLALVPPSYKISDQEMKQGLIKDEQNPGTGSNDGSVNDSLDDEDEVAPLSEEDDELLSEFMETVQGEFMDNIENNFMEDAQEAESLVEDAERSSDLEEIFVRSKEEWVSRAEDDFILQNVVEAIPQSDKLSKVEGMDCAENLTELRVHKKGGMPDANNQIDLEAALDFDQLPWVAIEVDGPHHYFANHQAPLGRGIIRERLLKKLGWKVVHIPYRGWCDRNRKEQKEHILLLLESKGVNPDSFLKKRKEAS